MVDFKKLRSSTGNQTSFVPDDIFRRLPKPLGFNDLYKSQAEVLDSWFENRNNQDAVVKLHTGGGKTIVGLLIGYSSLIELKRPVLYLAPTKQLVNQNYEKSQLHGIPCVKYEAGKPFPNEFLNSEAILIASYQALFHGRSRFGLSGTPSTQQVSTIICDDSHVAFNTIRKSFTLEIFAAKNEELYSELTSIFRYAFIDIGMVGTFDDVVSGGERRVLDVPYWAWTDNLKPVRQRLSAVSGDFKYEWPLLRDHLQYCHALVDDRKISITSYLPLVHLFPSFVDAERKIYMSATITDDSEIIRTFDAEPEAVKHPLTSRSLAGVSERMILIPELMPFDVKLKPIVKELTDWSSSQNIGSAILVPSDRDANWWSDTASIAIGSKAFEGAVEQLKSGNNLGPFVFSNRYDGIDLQGDSCRLLILCGLPGGTSSYELFRASSLHGGKMLNRMLAQRIEQGMGRASRGAGDHSVVILVGNDITSWISKSSNYNFLTQATRAQIEMGMDITGEIVDKSDFTKTLQMSIDRDDNWVKYHAETLANLVNPANPDAEHLDIFATERKVLRQWMNGYPEKAIATIEKAIESFKSMDNQTRGWLEQLGAKISYQWGNKDRASDFQREAFAHNRFLTKPVEKPPYVPVTVPGTQAQRVTRGIGEYRMRRGYLHKYKMTSARLTPEASPNIFEEALKELAQYLGFEAERFDHNGEGPDILWLLSDKLGIVIEAKSRKKGKAILNKGDHGQLLIAERWFQQNYPHMEYILGSIYPTSQATKAAAANDTFVLSYAKLADLVAEGNKLLSMLCESQLGEEELLVLCEQALESSPLKSENIVANYFERFEVVEEQ